MGTIIPVVFASDDAYTMPTSVAITSMLMNADAETMYEIFVMIDKNFSAINKEKLMSIKEKFLNFNLSFIEVGDEYDNVKIMTSHLSKQTYFRLSIHNILTQYEKVLYLDSDILVLKDLTSLFNIDMGNNYIAGVRHPVYFFSEHNAELYRKRRIKNMQSYINAGILVMNLEQMRHDKIEQIFNKFLPLNFPSDQDVINSSCFGKIVFAEFKYNVMPKCSKFIDDKRITVLYDYKDFVLAFQDPTIIHFADKVKPWQSNKIMFFNSWKFYYKRSPFANEPLQHNEKTVRHNNKVSGIKKLKTVLFSYILFPYYVYQLYKIMREKK